MEECSSCGEPKTRISGFECFIPEKPYPDAAAAAAAAPLCGLLLWYSTSSTVHTAPLTFSTRMKHLWRLRLCLTAFYTTTKMQQIEVDTLTNLRIKQIKNSFDAKRKRSLRKLDWPKSQHRVSKRRCELQSFFRNRYTKLRFSTIPRSLRCLGLKSSTSTSN